MKKIASTHPALSYLAGRLRVIPLLLLIALPLVSPAQTASRNPLEYEFTYSLIETDGDIDQVLAALQEQITAALALSGARHYAIWTPAEKPDDAPFSGLDDSQLGVMLAWPRPTDELLPSLQILLESVRGVTGVSTKAFTPIYLADGLDLPVGSGFFVHRDEHYASADVDRAVTLSREAWVSWEPTWGTRVVGLFREKPDADGIARLTRIAWYADYEAWLRTRNSQEDPESARRFAERRQILIEGSGIAVATDLYLAE